MKIDPFTGRLKLESGLELSPRVTRSEFLASPEGVASTVTVRNEPWCSFAIVPTKENVSLSLSFNAEVLTQVRIGVTDPPFSWSEWSKDREMQRKAGNDKWLMSMGLAQGEYPWGSVRSVFDAIGGFSAIIIRYEPAT
jgi:hypothetical protein